MTQTGCLIFVVDSVSLQAIAQVQARLALDYSPPAFTEEKWFLSSNPIHMLEFADVIKYMPKLESLFSSEMGNTQVIPGCLSSRNLIWRGKETNPRAIMLASGAFAELGGTFGNNGMFQQEPGITLNPPPKLMEIAISILNAHSTA